MSEPIINQLVANERLSNTKKYEMNIGMILDNEFTGDMRVENEVFSLSEAGFNVYVLCFNHGGKPNKENFHGAQIIRLDISIFRKNKMKGFANTMVDFYTWYWAKKIKKFVEECKIDVLHVHDLYLLGGAFRANKKLAKKLKIVGDLHENYASALKYYKFSNSFPGKYIISIPKWEKTEVKWTNEADHIITVIEEAKNRYIELGVPDKNITVVSNYVNSDFFLSAYTDGDMRNKFDDKFVLSYIGGLDTHRGLEAVIKSLLIIKQKIPNAILVIVGAGRNESDLVELAATLGVTDMVSFEGWQDSKKLPLYCEISDICLIPHLKTEHTDNTIPHKLFQYMLLGKAIITSDCVPLSRILKETKSGLTFVSNDEHNLAEKIIQLYNDSALIKEMGENGKKAVENKYNWNNTAVSLINLYKTLNN